MKANRRPAILAAVITIVGCAQGPLPPPVATKTTTAAVAKAEAEHGHSPGDHGGIIVEIGRDNYHCEAVFEKGGLLRLYILGSDERKVQEVESQALQTFIKAEGDAEAESIVLRAEPQQGDRKDMTSQFLGQLPKDLVGKKLEVTIPSIRIGADRFRIAFKSVPAGNDHGMPAKVSDEAERKLYLTPGGKYTDADIKANGGKTATEKFAGIKAEHDLKPKVGDKICPITLTKANPKFAWVIGGQSYEFCCPPCVDEFVGMAKEKPAEILPPEEYRKK